MLTTSVREEVSSVLHHGRRGNTSITGDQTAGWLDAAGLGELELAHPLRLSGGQRQRLSVLLSLAGRPALVLLDEPTGAQDTHGTERILRLVAAGREQRTTLIVTHEPEVFAEIATHRVHVAGGRIVTIEECGSAA